jgi:hypothetical protein
MNEVAGYSIVPCLDATRDKGVAQLLLHRHGRAYPYNTTRAYKLPAAALKASFMVTVCPWGVLNNRFLIIWVVIPLCASVAIRALSISWALYLVAYAAYLSLAALFNSVCSSSTPANVFFDLPFPFDVASPGGGLTNLS